MFNLQEKQYMINYILNRPSRKELIAQIDDLQTTVANLENQRDSNHADLKSLVASLENSQKDNESLTGHLNNIRSANVELMEVLKRKDQSLFSLRQDIATKKNEFEFLEKNLNDTICHLRTKLDEKINAVKALTSALDKKILTEPVKRKYVRKGDKK